MCEWFVFCVLSSQYYNTTSSVNTCTTCMYSLNKQNTVYFTIEKQLQRYSLSFSFSFCVCMVHNVCVRACVCVCVHACVRACIHVCVYLYLFQIRRLTTIITTNRVIVRTIPLPTPPIRAVYIYINKSYQNFMLILVTCMYLMAMVDQCFL